MYIDAFTSFPVLETERLILREHRESDVEGLSEYENDPDLLRFTDAFPPVSELSNAIYIWTHEAYQSKKFIRWCTALKENDRCIGGVFLFLPYGDDTSGRRMDIAYDISPRYRNKGYASEAIRKVVTYGFEKMALKRIQAQIMPENTASIRAVEKCGFVHEGTLRNYCHYTQSNELKTMVMMACVPKDPVQPQ